MPEITFERLKMLVADLAMTEALLKDEVAALRARIAELERVPSQTT